MTVQSRIGEVTERIRERSATSRAQYLERIHAAGENRTRRVHLSCSNLAHGFAACAASDKAGAGRRHRAQYRHHHRL